MKFILFFQFFACSLMVLAWGASCSGDFLGLTSLEIAAFISSGFFDFLSLNFLYVNLNTQRNRTDPITLPDKENKNKYFFLVQVFSNCYYDAFPPRFFLMKFYLVTCNHKRLETPFTSLSIFTLFFPAAKFTGKFTYIFIREAVGWCD